MASAQTSTHTHTLRLQSETNTHMYTRSHTLTHSHIHTHALQAARYVLRAQLKPRKIVAYFAGQAVGEGERERGKSARGRQLSTA